MTLGRAGAVPWDPQAATLGPRDAPDDVALHVEAAAGPRPAVIVRRHEAGGVRSEAAYSPCETYRYALTRTWDEELPRLAWVMLNPSTASELADDPTVARCVARARAGGWGAVRVCNLFALRETLPARLRAHTSPEGPGNAAVLADACVWADAVAAAWGNHGAHRGRGPAAAAALRREALALLHLGLTRAGHPRHPLYVGYSVPLAAWGEDGAGDPRR